jgi:hypothetical protein
MLRTSREYLLTLLKVVHIIRSGVSRLNQRKLSLTVSFPRETVYQRKTMPRLLFFFLLIFLKAESGNPAFSRSVPQLQGQTPSSRGEWLAHQIDDRETARDGRVIFKMRLFDRQERVRERDLIVLSKKYPAGDKSLTRFTRPADIAGTGFLVWEHKSAGGSKPEEDERFLFLPSLARVRRIAGSEAQESFVGSDFTYEDISGRKFEDYTYTLVNDTAANGTAYTLESRAEDPNAKFPRVVSTVRKDNFVVIHADIYGKGAEIAKVFDASKVEKIGKYWTVTAMAMKDLRQKTRTEMTVEKAEFDVGLPDEAFTRRELEKVIR